MTPRVLAIDIGGTKLAAAVVGRTGAITNRATAATPPSSDPAVVAATLRGLVHRLLDATGGGRELAGVGIGSAGPLDPVAGTVSPLNIPAWRGFPIVAEVAELVPERPVALAGDGHCMALGEHWSAGGLPSRALLGIVVSTGVGGGIVVEGRVFSGATGNAGHIGHVIVDAAGQPCPCGSQGCVETYASGPAITRWATAHGWAPRSGTPDARAVAEGAPAGHPVAVMAFQRAAHALAAGIVSAAALVDLDDVVIGGGVASAGEVLLAPLQERVRHLAGFDFIQRVRVRRSTLGTDAGLLGAAALGFAAAG